MGRVDSRQPLGAQRSDPKHKWANTATRSVGSEKPSSVAIALMPSSGASTSMIVMTMEMINRQP